MRKRIVASVINSFCRPFLIIGLFFLVVPVSSVFAVSPTFSGITDNRASFANSQIPTYEKLEVTFQLQTAAVNPQMPYDAAPPPGVTPGIGVTVNAVFTDPSGAVFTQPAFYFQDFEYIVKGNRDWYYPTNNYSWKVRFAPNKTGSWKYKLTAQDAGGTTVSAESTFTVSASQNKGFINVSKTDKRYFEYEDGTYFPALGYNMAWGEIKWDNPVQSNKANFTAMSQNGIQLIRTWLAPWGIYSSLDNPWASMRWGPDDAAIDTRAAYPGSDVAMKVEQYWEPCPVYGGWKPSPGMKPNKKYRVFMRYINPTVLPAIKDATKPNNYGVVAKLGYWQNSPSCADPSDGTLNKGVPILPYIKNVSTKDANGNWNWQMIEGSFDTSASIYSGMDTLPKLYIAMENIDHNVNPQNPDGSYKDLPRFFVDRFEIHEDAPGCGAAANGGTMYGLTNGQCGPDIIEKPWMAQHQYMAQELSYRWDQIMDLAKQYNVFFKLEILEKNEKISNWIDYDGVPIPFDLKCWDADQNNNPAKCPSNNWFFGNWGTPTKIYWLQQAWWRYLQARWGYSTQIHSFELLNEADPFNGLHWNLADNFAKYMHQFKPNAHLVTTSMWTSLPFEFWADPVKYPNIDYADVHQYVFQGGSIDLNISKPGGPGTIHISDAADFYDSATAVQKLSMQVGAKQPYGTGKPIMRGETGFVVGNTDGWNHGFFNNDTQGIWLHNYVWAGINAGGLIESYWYGREHIYPTGRDLRPVFKPYYDFIKTIPLSNGRYVDSSASSTNVKIRVWGQKDIPGGRAHVWIQNIDHTWKNVVDNVSIPAQSGIVTIPGFSANRNYQVQWWNTYTGVVSSTVQVTSNSSGIISLTVSNLTTDTAVQISDPALPSPTIVTPTPTCGLPGDLNCSGKVDTADMLQLLGNFGKSGVGDINNSGKADSADLLILLGNFGK